MIQGESVTKVITTWFEEYDDGGIDVVEIFDAGVKPPVPRVGDVVAISERQGADKMHADTRVDELVVTKVEHEFNKTTGTYHVFVTGKAASK